MAPDGDLEKPYLNEKLGNKLTYWTEKYVQDGNYPSIRYWQATLASDRPDADLDASCSHFTSPWMDDYMLIALGHIMDIGYPSHALVNWLGQSIINRFSAPGYNPNRGAVYHIPVKYRVSPGVAADYPTWLDVNNGFLNDAGPADLPNPNYPNNYTYSARAALSHNHRTATWSSESRAPTIDQIQQLASLTVLHVPVADVHVYTVGPRKPITLWEQ